MNDAKATPLTLEQAQALVTRAPFHQWLGLKVVSVGEGEIEIHATWREEWVVNPDRRYTHGGILATLVDQISTLVQPVGDVPLLLLENRR